MNAEAFLQLLAQLTPEQIDQLAKLLARQVGPAPSLEDLKAQAEQISQYGRITGNNSPNLGSIIGGQ